MVKWCAHFLDGIFLANVGDFFPFLGCIIYVLSASIVSIIFQKDSFRLVGKSWLFQWFLVLMPTEIPI